MDSYARKELAMNAFLQGYNCAQSVALAFEDCVPFSREELLRLTSSCGGGMGRLREVCGAVSSMFMVAGLLWGYDGPESGDVKKAHYARIQELAKRFEEKSGSIVCRELLGLTQKRDDPTPAARTLEYYQDRPCKALVGLAAETLNDYLLEQETESSAV